MPTGTKVDSCFQKLKGKKGAGHAAAICQASTRQSLKTGKSLAEKMAALERYCGGDGGKPGPCPSSNSQPNTTSHKTSNWLSVAKKIPAAALAKAKGLVKSKYALLEKRYGRKYALAIIGAGLAATPLPIPGSGLLAAAPIVAVAELHRRLSGAHAEPPTLGVPADDEKMKQLGVAFIKSLNNPDQYAEIPTRQIVNPKKGKDGLFIQPEDNSADRERDEQHNRDRFANHFHYADPYSGNTRTFDEKGNYNCGRCNMANGSECLLVVHLTIDKNAGSCGDWENKCAGDAEMPLEEKTIETAGYGVAANGEGFGCHRCPYASKAHHPDSRGRDLYCGKGDMRVFPLACCALNGAKTVPIDKQGVPTQHAEKFSESASLPDQEVFATGVHRGKAYNHRDLDQMVENYKRNSAGAKPRFPVPAVIGHEETQEFLDRSDIPAAGWVSGIRNEKYKCDMCKGAGKVGGDTGPATCPKCVGTGVASTLKTSFSDVPGVVARLLKRKAYRTVSAEVYDEPPEGLEGEGKMLRRVAFLGGEIPQIKTLGQLDGLYEHSEDLPLGLPSKLYVRAIHKPQKKSGRRWWTCFSELQPMNRDEMLAKLKEYGFNMEMIGKAPDEVLAEILRVYDTGANEAGEEEEETGIEDGSGSDDGGAGRDIPPEDGTGEQAIPEGEEDHGPDITSHGPEGVDRSDLGAPHQDHDDLPEPANPEERMAMQKKAKAFLERAKKMMAKYGDDSMRAGNVSGATVHPAEVAQGNPSGFDQVPGRHPKKVTMSAAYAEMKREFTRLQQLVTQLQKSVKSDVGDLQKFREEQIVAAKRETVDMALDALVKEGRLPPVLKPHYHSLLMKADTRTVVEKFKENGKIRELTEFEKVLRDLRRDLPSKFAELFKAPTTTTAAPKEERKEWAKQTYQRFSESFRMSGCKEEDFLKQMETMDQKEFAAEQKKWDERAAA